MTMVGPALDGVRVIDLSTVLMAPYTARILADWGADVIKVESPGGDGLRSVGDTTGAGMGPLFINTNRGKRSVVLDLKQPRGREVLRRMVQDADVFLHNVRPPAAARLGITADELLGINPQLVHCAFRGYGAGGRNADRPAYDDVIQAASGVASAQAVGGAEPGYWRSAVADKVMGLYGAAAVCAALRAREATGTGRAIEVPMFEGMVSFMMLDRQGGWVHDPPSGPTGYARTDSVHRRPYATLDGHLAVMIYADKHWTAFFDLIGRPELTADPRFCDLGARTRHIDELYELLAEEMTTRTTAEWMDAFAAADIPHGPVNSVEELFDDPHLQDAGFFDQVHQPGVGTVRAAQPPLDMGGRPASPGAAPALGEHTDDVLNALGLDPATVADLDRHGVVGRATVAVPD